MNTPDKEDQPCRVVGIAGSIRPGSYTRMAVRLALKGAEELRCEAQLIDLRDYQLLFCDGKEDESQYPKDVFRLREEVKQAQGIILGTPEYHGGYSGVLKNVLDLMGFEEFEGKMLGLVGVSGGAMGAFGPMNSLREVGRGFMPGWFLSKPRFRRSGRNLTTPAISKTQSWRSAFGMSDGRWRVSPICTAPAKRTNSCRSGKKH